MSKKYIDHFPSVNEVHVSDIKQRLSKLLEETDGILPFHVPTYVPRSFLTPGRRLRLNADQLFPFGIERGGIDERWFASTTEAKNQGRFIDEGLSYVTDFENGAFLFKDCIAEMPEILIGSEIWNAYHRWPCYSKFFDNMGPIPHHFHQMPKDAALTGQESKPEAYYYPIEYNTVYNDFPLTFMGLNPCTTKDQIKDCLNIWNTSDNKILTLSRAYLLQPGTGWSVPAGILHAPGSLVTYEPQWGSDVYGMFQNVVGERFYNWEMCVANVPKDKHQDLDFIINQLDWEKNIDPFFYENYFRPPLLDNSSIKGKGNDEWIVYGSLDQNQGEFLPDRQSLFSAKRLTVPAGEVVDVNDGVACGAIVLKGQGKINNLRLSAHVMVNFGELVNDECFITYEAGRKNVRVENTGSDELVVIRFFGPDRHGVPKKGNAYALLYEMERMSHGSELHSNESTSPLHLAASVGNLDEVQAMISLDEADPQSCDSDGYSILQLLCMSMPKKGRFSSRMIREFLDIENWKYARTKKPNIWMKENVSIGRKPVFIDIDARNSQTGQTALELVASQQKYLGKTTALFIAAALLDYHANTDGIEGEFLDNARSYQTIHRNQHWLVMIIFVMVAFVFIWVMKVRPMRWFINQR